MLAHIGLLCMQENYIQEIIKLLMSILLVWNIFQKKLKDLLEIKTLKQTYLEFKHTIQ